MSSVLLTEPYSQPHKSYSENSPPEIWFSFSDLIFFSQIEPIKEQKALLQEIYRNSEGELSSVDIITYIEVLAESSPLLGYMNSTTSSKDDRFNSTLIVSTFKSVV